MLIQGVASKVLVFAQGAVCEALVCKALVLLLQGLMFIGSCVRTRRCV